MTYSHRNVTMVCGASHHIFGSCIYCQDTKIWFDFKSSLTSAISNFSESGPLASYVSCHIDMAYDTAAAAAIADCCLHPSHLLLSATTIANVATAATTAPVLTSTPSLVTPASLHHHHCCPCHCGV
jgi:hypothetical protein